MIVALIAYSILGIIPMLLDDLYAILVSRFIVGIAEAAILTAGNAMMGDYSRAKSAKSGSEFKRRSDRSLRRR